MAAPMVEILVGFICSGKSTYCKQRAKEGALVVNDDSIVTAIHGGDYTLYDERLKPLYKDVEDTILKWGLAMGRIVIIDRPCFKRTTRQRYIGLAKACDVPVIAVMFPQAAPQIHAERRFKKESRGHTLDYWIRVAEAHARQFEEVSMDEGFDNVIPSEVALQIAGDDGED